MAITPKLADGESFVKNRSSATARRLLELADKAGLSGTVRTTSHGYIVPSELLADEDPAGAVIGGEVVPDEQEDNGDSVDLFDPSKSTVEEVNDYLSGADDTERERVLAAETEGKKRKGILDSADTSEGDK